MKIADWLLRSGYGSQARVAAAATLGNIRSVLPTQTGLRPIRSRWSFRRLTQPHSGWSESPL